MKSTTDIDGIQYLRAIAALMVVAHHARHYFPDVSLWSTIGSRGVDIFFVISGFIMAHSTRAFQSGGDRSAQAMSFLLKRFVRVVPLYWIALLWTSKKLLATGDGAWGAMQDLLFIPHYHAVYTSAIYPYLVPGWSINYEMFFYALFAASMLLGKLRYVFMTVTLGGLLVLGLFEWTAAPLVFYTSSVLLEFLLGIGVFFAMRFTFGLGRPILVFLTLSGLCLLSVENSDASRGYADGPFAALIVWSTVLWAKDLKIGWLHAIGDASYSIYLFHLASFWIPATLLHKAGIETASPLTVVCVIAIHVATAVCIGLAIHRVVERPLMSYFRDRLETARLGRERALVLRP
ncbi:MAG: acyltransferase [Caldimonas sp.]